MQPTMATNLYTPGGFWASCTTTLSLLATPKTSWVREVMEYILKEGLAELRKATAWYTASLMQTLPVLKHCVLHNDASILPGVSDSTARTPTGKVCLQEFFPGSIYTFLYMCMCLCPDSIYTYVSILFPIFAYLCVYM